MAAALLVSFVGFRLARQRDKPVLAAQSLWPSRTDIDRPLLIGSALFGVGWGLAGLCPGAGPREPRDPNAAGGRIRACHGSGFGSQGHVGQVSGWRRDESTFHCERRLNLNTGDSKVLCLDRVTCKTFLTRILPSFQRTIWIPVALPCGASVTPT